MATPKPTGIPASIIADQVDELGAIEQKLLPFRADIAREEMLRKAVRAHFDASPADMPFEAKGDKFVALVGPRALEKTINLTALIKAIGIKAYSLFATTTLKALEENVSPVVRAGCVSSGRTGSRTLKVFERGTVALALVAFALAGSARAAIIAGGWSFEANGLPRDERLIAATPEVYASWFFAGEAAAPEPAIAPVPVDSIPVIRFARGPEPGDCDTPEPVPAVLMLLCGGAVLLWGARHGT